MGSSNFTLSRIFSKIKGNIIDSKIERIVSLSNNSYVFSLFKNGKCFDLLLSLDPTLPLLLTSFNTKAYESNQPTYALNMLRKYFNRGIITSFEKIENDRIFILNIKKWSETYQLIEHKLIFECFPLSPNIIVTDKNYNIVDAFKKADSLEAKHLIYKGIKYTFPESLNKHFDLSTSIEEIKNKVSRKEYAYLSSLNQDDYCLALKKCLNEDKLYLFNKEVSCFALEGSKEINLDELFTLIKDNKILENKTNKHQEIFKLVEQKIKTLKKKIVNLTQDQEKFKNGDLYLRYGQTLYLGEEHYQKGLKKITINDITIPLDDKLDLSSNAQRYFKLYKKSKSGIEQVALQLIKAEEELKYFERINNQLQFASTNEIQEIIFDLFDNHYIKEKKVQKQINLKPKNKRFKPHFIIYKETKIGFGLTSYQNEELTFSLANKNHTYVHVKDYHGPHVIIFSDNIDDDTLLLAGEIACYYASISQGEVQYTLRKYIKKVPNQRGLALLNKYQSFIVKEIRKSTIALLNQQ